MAVINAVKNSVNPYNVDLIAEKLALAAVESWDYYEDTCQKSWQPEIGLQKS